MSSQIKRDYFWNTASSLMGAVSLVLLQLAVTRAVGLEEAGAFAFALALALQFQMVGAYEVRPFQATDVEGAHPFGDYYALRLLTVAAMIVIVAIYAVGSGKPGLALSLIVLVGVLRAFDAFEDVFYGEFQRRNRLDIAGRVFFFRTLAMTVAFIGALVVARSTVVGVSAAIVASGVVLAILIVPPARGLFSLRPTFDWRAIRSLAITCFPLFLASFCSLYVTNAPRFGIERYLSNDAQGLFAILFVPAQAINVLSLFVFRPLLTRMATRWGTGDLRGFMRLIQWGFLGTLAASVATAVVVWAVGVPLLGWLYGVPLEGHRSELIILVAGGAFYAFSVILYYALVTVRRQRTILVGYGLTAAVATVAIWVLTPQHGLAGASFGYVIATIVLNIMFASALVVTLRRARSSRALDMPDAPPGHDRPEVS